MASREGDGSEIGGDGGRRRQGGAAENQRKIGDGLKGRSRWRRGGPVPSGVAEGDGKQNEGSVRKGERKTEKGRNQLGEGSCGHRAGAGREQQRDGRGGQLGAGGGGQTGARRGESTGGRRPVVR